MAQPHSFIIMNGAVEFGKVDATSPPTPPDGMVAVEVPFPAKDWSVALDSGEYVVTPRPVPIEELRPQKWAQVKAARDKAEYAGCMTPLGRVDTDPDSQRKIAGAVQMAMIAGEAFSLEW